MANLLNREFNWKLGPENIGITNGSQTAFFILFNLLSGSMRPERGQTEGLTHGFGPSQEVVKKILLPFTPEYIGYADQGIGQDHFVSQRPVISYEGDHGFKYMVDFSRLDIPSDIGAICVSRPTNPTGNVLTDEEMSNLDQLAQGKDIPLLVDNAYGTPFPHMIYVPATPLWNDNIILGMSLSKIGLPSARTGIIIGNPKVIEAVTAVNAITSLSNGTIGQMILTPLVESGEILKVSKEIIQPFYQQRSNRAQEAMAHHLRGLPWRVHKSEGALFLWVWFDDPRIDTHHLYQRLKEQNVIIVPGKYFFFGLDNHTRQPDTWVHRNQCFRMNFAGDPTMVDRGLEIIGQEVRRMLSGT